jgi:glycosyltransferase involved in cell wall biosynthesis
MQPQSSVSLSIVVPVYNEELIIPELVRRMVEAAESITPDYEIIFVNDGSRDSSLSQLIEACNGKPRLHYINFSRNFGHQIAITAGMDYAKGDAIVTIDGDLQDPPELIADMYREYLNGYKVIYAKRKARKGETFFKRFTARAFYRILARLVSFEIPLDVGDFRLISRDVLEYLKQMKEYDKYLRGQIAWLGFKSTYVYFDRDERKFGKTNYPFKKMLRLAFNGITAFSDSPLKWATSLGFAVCGISFLIGVYALYSYFIGHNTVPGWASLIISVTFLGGVQLLSIGIIGEYIARIISNVRNRPLYVVDSTDENM